MSHAVAHEEDLQRPLVVSTGLHSLLLLALLFAIPRPHHHGQPWGGPGGSAVSVSLVESLPGITLPRPEVVPPATRATQSKGLHRSEPRRESPPAGATPLPRFREEQKSLARLRPPARAEQTTETPPEAIPYGKGGPPVLPYTAFQAGATEGGMAFGGDAAFGARYPFYVESVRRRISSNWLISTIDPYVQFAPRLVLTFEILRDGNVVNIQMLRSSGIPSVDRSAIRALRDSSPLDRLPSDYSGDKVVVEFWFDFRR